jgi:hypothetical protein
MDVQVTLFLCIHLTSFSTYVVGVHVPKYCGVCSDIFHIHTYVVGMHVPKYYAKLCRNRIPILVFKTNDICFSENHNIDCRIGQPC